MLNVTELRNGTFFKEDNQILEVLTYEHNKMGRGSGTIKVKVRNLKTGSVTEKSFITGAKVDEADVENKKVQYLYSDSNQFFFMDPSTFEQFSLSSNIVGEQAKFFKDGLEVSLVVSGGQALGVELPLSLVYQVIEAGPEEKGNSVSNVFKEVVLDNGLKVKAPMFIKDGEKIKVDTRTGQYIERVKQ